jgi:hypothetical protein
MLNDPGFSYQHIAKTFGLTRQRIAQLANELSIYGSRRYRQRESMRMLHREPRVIKVEYPPGIRSVINKIKRSGFEPVFDFPTVKDFHRRMTELRSLFQD